MVVAEVSKTFSQFEKVLGEHRWGEFLREPSPEERDKKTKVYYSTYTNSRALQKDGKSGWESIENTSNFME
jgi:hypothetical protein